MVNKKATEHQRDHNLACEKNILKFSTTSRHWYISCNGSIAVYDSWQSKDFMLSIIFIWVYLPFLKVTLIQNFSSSVLLSGKGSTLLYGPSPPLRAVIAGNDCGNNLAITILSSPPCIQWPRRPIRLRTRRLSTNHASACCDQYCPMHPGHQLTLLRDEAGCDDESEHQDGTKVTTSNGRTL